MNGKIIILFVGMSAVLGGCTMAPEYNRPVAPVPSEFPSGVAYAGNQSPADTPKASDLKWKDFLTDKKLQQVIEIALTNNRDLRVAALNVERARAIYGIQRADLLPQVDATASGSYQHLPGDLSGTGGGKLTKSYNVNLGVASWEIDFFGRIRSLKDKALEEYLATEQAHRSAQILLVSSVATAYLTLAADRENLALAEYTLTIQQHAYNLIKRRFDLGLISELDVHRAQTQVDAARGDLAQFTQLAAQDENALNLLLGSAAPAELLPKKLDQITPPTQMSAGLSSEVLLLRPDVLQAENLLKATHANIGAARASFFPEISLTAALGTASADLSGLFAAGSGAWSYAPKIVMPIFDARTWSAYKVTKVEREIAVAEYEKAIQNAFREVADALAVAGTIDNQMSAQQSFVNAVSETYRLANSRYDKGIDNYLNVLDAQRSLYAAQQKLITLYLVKLANQIRLYAVLGGGWQ